MSEAPEPAEDNGAPAPAWRIDDLAQRAGVTVDTIRYYQREDLLPRPERSGRRKLYGPDHLEGLEQIKALQARGFSLAGIRELLDTERAPILTRIFGDESTQAYTWDELLERAGVDPDLAHDAGAAGLVRDPAELDREAYDGDDLQALRAVGRMERAGLPREAILELVRIYVRHFDAMQRETFALFSGRGLLHLEGEELNDFQMELADAVPQLMPATDQILEFVHRRTLQRLALDAVADARTRSEEEDATS